MSPKKFISVIIISLVLAFGAGCEKEKDNTGCNPGQGPSQGLVVIPKDLKCDNELKRGGESSLHLKAINKKALSITHHNAILNCCPTLIYVLYKIEQGTIYISEKEVHKNCKCVCPYTLNYILSPLREGVYTIKMDKYLPFEIDFNSELDISINLIEQPIDTEE